MEALRFGSVKGTCYFLCGKQAEFEQDGKATCSECSLHYGLRGQRFPLRPSTWRNDSERLTAFKLDMPPIHSHSAR